MNNTGLYNFPQHESGDTFNGTTLTVTVNDAALNLTDAEIVATFKLRTNKDYIRTLSTGSGITVTTPENGVFEVDKQIISWRPGTYDYEIKFTLSDGTVKTYIEGTWIITD